jgi:transposase-like protein
MAEIIDLTTLASYFSDEEEAYKLLERIRWPDGPVCPHCGTIDSAYYLEPRDGPRKTRTGKQTFRRVWKCADCRQQFSVTVGTIFEDSKIPLAKWLMAIHLMCAGKNGVAALELKRTLGISYKSAWFMCHRIRKAMEREPLAGMLSGVVEADETYIGGTRKGTPAGRPGRQSHKTAVVSLVERGGEVRSQVVEDVSALTLHDVIIENVDPSSTLMTDSFQAYNRVGRKMAKHETVDHGKKEYVRGDVHVQTAEGYFSQLKRSLDGTHHHVSRQHLHRYVGEFDFRYNTRKMEDGERTELAIRKAAGKRLTYR